MNRNNRIKTWRCFDVHESEWSLVRKRGTKKEGLAKRLSECENQVLRLSEAMGRFQKQVFGTSCKSEENAVVSSVCWQMQPLSLSTVCRKLDRPCRRQRPHRPYRLQRLHRPYRLQRLHNVLFLFWFQKLYRPLRRLDFIGKA